MSEIKLVCSDCMKGLRSLQDESVDLVVTDPPYLQTSRGKSCRPNYMKDGIRDNLFDYPLIEPSVWMSEVYRVLKPDTHFYTFCNTNDLQRYLETASKVGFKLHNVISMIKDTKMPNQWYLKYVEYVLFFRKGKAKPINDPTSRNYAFVNMPTQKNGKIHITQKPQNFIEKLITNSSQPGDIVLDPFMGGATTAAACVATNRNFLGYEIDADSFNAAQTRMEEILTLSAGSFLLEIEE